jgi:hypothetical protein
MWRISAPLWNLNMKHIYILWVNVSPLVSKLKGLVRVVLDLYACWAWCGSCQELGSTCIMERCQAFLRYACKILSSSEAIIIRPNPIFDDVTCHCVCNGDLWSSTAEAWLGSVNWKSWSCIIPLRNTWCSYFTLQVKGIITCNHWRKTSRY